MNAKGLGMPRYPAPPLASPPPLRPDAVWPTPSEAQCRAWWDDHAMMPHIKDHSARVAQVAEYVAVRAERAGHRVDVAQVRASALLHDLAKTYTIEHGGNHSQIGAAWVMDLTANPAVAQGVMHHVYWPFTMDAPANLLPFCVIYGDKRVSHDRIVDMEARFQDLMDRYGTTLVIRAAITKTHEQALVIERALGEIIGEDLSCASF